jgi:transcriptional regulator with XRE-family HTH domain
MNSYRATLATLARRARTLRILRELQQADVASRAGLGLATVRRFERTGRASTDTVLRIATVLGAEDGVDRLFEPPKYRTLDEALAQGAAPTRQRVRRRR